MSKLIDLTGKTFGRLTVVEFSHSIKPRPRNSVLYWKCRCVCGNEKVIKGEILRCGKSKSCGCLSKEILSLRVRKHGENICRTKEYTAWAQMLQRCRAKEGNRNYANYPGRGIKVCERWVTYENFLNDMGRAPTPLHSLDRINNDKGYDPTNCRWATNTEQQNNTRRTRRWLYKGESKTLREWCDILGLKHNRVMHRLYDGWTPELAFETL